MSQRKPQHRMQELEARKQQCQKEGVSTISADPADDATLVVLRATFFARAVFIESSEKVFREKKYTSILSSRCLQKHNIGIHSRATDSVEIPVFAAKGCNACPDKECNRDPLADELYPHACAAKLMAVSVSVSATTHWVTVCLLVCLNLSPI